jgi:hypothetical protein
VLAQHEVADKRIDLVVEGGQARLASNVTATIGMVRIATKWTCNATATGAMWLGILSCQRISLLLKQGGRAHRTLASAEARAIFPHTQSGNMFPQGDFEEEDFDDFEGNPAEDDDSDHDDEDCSSDDPDNGFNPSGRRAEDITTAEIQDAILSALSECPNQSCTLHSLTSRVLKEVGVLTRGNPRIEFEKRVMRSLVALEKRESIERYRAKNKRIRLV